MKRNLTTQAGNIEFWQKVRKEYAKQRESEFLCDEGGDSTFGIIWSADCTFQKEVIELAELFVRETKPKNTMVLPFDETTYKYSILFIPIDNSPEYPDNLIRNKFLNWVINHLSKF